MKYFFGFLVSIGLIILVFIMIMRGLSGGGEEKAPNPLSAYADTSSVMRLTVSGPIVGDQQFQSYQITVGRDQTTIETRQGYEGNALDSRAYSNNEEGYTNFLRALDFAGFAKGDEESPNKDERGTCAKGHRFIMQIKNGESDIQRYWSTDCGKEGNFKGDSQEVRQLFIAQIPKADFSKLTNKLNL
jgi:hypothetical protein